MRSSSQTAPTRVFHHHLYVSKSNVGGDVLCRELAQLVRPPDKGKWRNGGVVLVEGRRQKGLLSPKVRAALTP